MYAFTQSSHLTATAAARVLPAAVLLGSISAHGDGDAHAHAHAHAAAGGINATVTNTTPEEFDILAAHVHQDETTGNIVFHMSTRGSAGSDKAPIIGTLENSTAYGYVWPTDLDSSVVGYDEGQGIVALIAATHGSFDDTPGYDENGDGNRTNDGDTWHTHWVVLVEAKENECVGASYDKPLKVKDLVINSSAKRPATLKEFPGLPMYLSNPGFGVAFDGQKISVNANVMDQMGDFSSINYDAVTVVLRINANLHDPFFCVENVFDAANGLKTPFKGQFKASDPTTPTDTSAAIGTKGVSLVLAVAAAVVMRWVP